MPKRLIRNTIFFTLLAILSCGVNREENENCKFLLNNVVYEELNLSLPQFGNLNSPGNSVLIPGGNGGIIVANLGFSFLAWDAADPNHQLASCSTLNPAGLTATCGCEDENTYDLSTGLAIGNGALECPLRNYRVEKSGNTLIISN